MRFIILFSQGLIGAVPDKPKSQLIITTGDTSDVDGFLALAEYSKVQQEYVHCFALFAY
jgi:hypothetical protein